MAAYLLARLNVRNPTAYTQYTARTPAIIAKYGGRFLVRGGQSETLEGAVCAERLVVVEFPSIELARAFYNSPEYQEAKSFRTPVSDAEFIIVQGI
jgi:uncharacterized protein (DUF1330 family)